MAVSSHGVGVMFAGRSTGTFIAQRAAFAPALVLAPALVPDAWAALGERLTDPQLVGGAIVLTAMRCVGCESADRRPHPVKGAFAFLTRG
ncbi:hypothetical protein [Thermomonospora umbrina]|uniref:hypothetical protein n=1 Tax=Thermomonospora umbrina TaxID=111806 RepID=UPI0014777A5B|nr:hypothetical protein [Thermomonospora umbrina]